MIMLDDPFVHGEEAEVYWDVSDMMNVLHVVFYAFC